MDMKVISIQTFNKMKLFGVAAAITFLPLSLKGSSNPLYQNQDTFVRTSVVDVPPSGTQNLDVLKNAPSPSFKIKGENKQAIIVVDLSKNILYKYDEKGNASIAYSICSGKPSTPTHTGIRYITHVENYPYKTAPIGSKRRKNPKDYGPKIICLDCIDTQTGIRSPIGEFIHGNRNPDSIGKYYSHGCMRMDNEVIKKLSTEVKSGQYVKIIK